MRPVPPCKEGIVCRAGGVAPAAGQEVPSDPHPQSTTRTSQVPHQIVLRRRKLRSAPRNRASRECRGRRHPLVVRKKILENKSRGTFRLRRPDRSNMSTLSERPNIEPRQGGGGEHALQEYAFLSFRRRPGLVTTEALVADAEASAPGQCPAVADPAWVEWAAHGPS